MDIEAVKSPNPVGWQGTHITAPYVWTAWAHAARWLCVDLAIVVVEAGVLDYVLPLATRHVRGVVAALAPCGWHENGCDARARYIRKLRADGVLRIIDCDDGVLCWVCVSTSKTDWTRVLVSTDG